MPDLSFAPLPDRGLFSVAGEEASDFLQGLISNDVTRADGTQALYATLLTAQGKFLHDFFVARMDTGFGPAFVFDAEGNRTPDLIRRLTMYKLRARVDIAALDEFEVYAGFGPGAAEAIGLNGAGAQEVAGGAVFADPRLGGLGVRAILPAGDGRDVFGNAGFRESEAGGYDMHRLRFGVPDGSRDIAVEKNFPLECGFDELNAIDYGKGCYIGQELTARTHHRGTVRKHLYRVAVSGPMPEPGTAVMQGDKTAGEMRSGHDGVGLAMLRSADVEAALAGGATLSAGEAALTPEKPDWANF